MRSTSVWAALALSLLLVLMAAEVAVLHPHSGDAPAFYDEACPLSQLFTSRSEVPAPQRIGVMQPLPALGLAVLGLSPADVTISVQPFDPRGPPFPA